MLLFVEEMDSWTLGIAVAAMLTIFMALRGWIRSRSSKKAESFPIVAPTGMWGTIQAMQGSGAAWFIWRTSQSLGTNVFRLPVPIFGTPMVVAVGDYKLARDILSDTQTTKPHQTYLSFDLVTNGVKSLFTNNGPYWHARRKGMAPGFSSNHVQRMNDVALAETDKWIETKLRPLIAQDKSFDVGKEMINLLLTAICKTAFDYSISSEEIEMFTHELDLVFREFLFKTNLNPLRRVFGVLLAEHRRAHLGAKKIHAFSAKVIDAYRKMENPTKGTIIDLICSNPCYKDDTERCADVTILMVAGHDTTAYSLAWTLKELARNPKHQTELRESIRAAKDGEAPHQLEAVRNTIRESIRLYPVSAVGSMRTVGRDFVTKDGKLIPAGSITFIHILSMLRDPAVFGKDNEEFRPSRWEAGNVTTEMNQAFVPFSVGRQNCVGQPLAMAELHCILPRIISQFDLMIEEEGSADCVLTLKPVGTMLKAVPATQS